MNSLPITCKDAKTTFLLARRAERLARPIVESVAGAWDLSIEVRLGAEKFTACPWHIAILCHYTKGAAQPYNLPTMPVHELFIKDSGMLEKSIRRMAAAAVQQIEATAKAEALTVDAELADDGEGAGNGDR